MEKIIIYVFGIGSFVGLAIILVLRWFGVRPTAHINMLADRRTRREVAELRQELDDLKRELEEMKRKE